MHEDIAENNRALLEQASIALSTPPPCESTKTKHYSISKHKDGETGEILIAYCTLCGRILAERYKRAQEQEAEIDDEV